MATLTDFCTLDLTLEFVPIGSVPSGFRLDVPFSGVCTSSYWDGERPAVGVDHVTVSADGIQDLDIQGRIGSGKEIVAYRAIGRGSAEGPSELFTFETANEDLAWLNSAIAVGIGSIDGNKLTLQLSIVER